MQLHKMGQNEFEGGDDLCMMMEAGALKIGAVHKERGNQWKMRLLSATNTTFGPPHPAYLFPFPCQHPQRACKLG